MYIRKNFYKYSGSQFDHSGVSILLFPFSNVSLVENEAIKPWFDSFYNKVVVVVVEKVSHFSHTTRDTYMREVTNFKQTHFECDIEKLSSC